MLVNNRNRPTDLKPAPSDGGHPGEIPAEDKPNILVVDDDFDLCILLVETLGRQGYSVTFKTSGLDALKHALQAPPDLIICDLELPGMRGEEMVAVLRQNEITMEIPVIYLTGCKERTTLRHSMNLGGDDLLIKPASPAEILAAVQAQIRRRGMVREVQRRRLRMAAEVFQLICSSSRPSETHPEPSEWAGTQDAPGAAAAEPEPIKFQINSPLLIKTNGRSHFIKISEIKALLAYGEYSRLCWGKDGATTLVHKSLKKWQQELPGEHFIRIHRSAIINLSYLNFVDNSHPEGVHVHLRDFPKVLPVSHRARASLNSHLKRFGKIDSQA